MSFSGEDTDMKIQGGGERSQAKTKRKTAQKTKEEERKKKYMY